MNWIFCPSCEEEFRVISDADVTTQYCPFCGENLPSEEEACYDWETGDNVRFR